MKLTISQMDTIYTRNGRSKDVVRKVAQDAGITEAEADAIAQVLEERRAGKIPKRVTESAPAAVSTSLADLRPQVLEAAKEVAIGASVADAKLAAGKGDTLTHNELSSLAAMFYSA